MTEFTGKVKRIVFENDQNLFKILDATLISELPDYDRKEIKITGNFGDIQVGGTYLFHGQLVVHNKFGLQFNCESYQQSLPHEKDSLINFLSSSKFPGIGKKAAEKIVSVLGDNALSVLKDKPEKVATLSLTKKQKDSLLNGVSAMDSYSEIVLKLAQYGLNKKVANRLYQIYHGETINKLKADPYAAIANVSGYAFKSADRMGTNLNMARDDPKRISGAVFQIMLDEVNKEGNTYIKLADLLTRSSKLLALDQFDSIANCINKLQHEGKVVVSGDEAALQNIFQTENEIALAMKNLVNRQNSDQFKEKDVQAAIEKAEKQLKIEYDDTQKMAIKNALTNPISILTGGPGTGKTTIINGILLALQKLTEIPTSTLYSSDPPFLLAAPTGRAAKRMEEITGITAKTIHRLLGLGIGENDATDLNELNGEILIIDEMSMVDMFLFKQLVNSIDQTKHVVFVGDKDQLPSVGPGNVFSDLIKADVFPTTVLEQIHRQGDDSSIITLAHAINEGQNPQIIFKKTKNYSFISCPTHEVDHVVQQIVEKALNHFDQDDIQVLGAMYQGEGGVINLNNVIQAIVNPAKTESKFLEIHDEIFRIGDRILQLQNNPEKDIYNGQIGKIVSIDNTSTKNCMIADFDGREISFSKKDMFDLTRAYAITIHKAQGSEFPLVILSLTMQNYVMLKRNLLYTAVTRAAQNLVLIGDPHAYTMALTNSGNDRQTGLCKKLKKQLAKNGEETLSLKEKAKIKAAVVSSNSDTSYILTPELIYSGEIDPMIGMQDVAIKRKK